MSRPTIRIHDLELNEVIDREMNDAEFAAYEAEQAKQVAEKAETEAKAQAKAAAQAKLAALGLTISDLEALGL